MHHALMKISESSGLDSDWEEEKHSSFREEQIQSTSPPPPMPWPRRKLYKTVLRNVQFLANVPEKFKF